MYTIDFYSEIPKDLDKLSNKVASEVRNYFKKFQTDPYKYSQSLYNQGGLNLEGYRKTYVADAKYRIISKIEDTQVKIVEIVAVGKREDKEVYKEASKRIES